MTDSAIFSPTRYARLLALLAAVAAALGALGWLPTARLAGPAGARAMVAGIGASFVATGLGGLPLLLARRGAAGAARPLLAAMALRFGLAAAAALVLGLSGWLPLAPALIWIALSYCVLLAAEAALTARQLAVEAAGPSGG